MLSANKVRPGAIKGDRRSTKRGTSIEFADYRDYTPGDDLRRLDWNIYARTERPYIKLLEDEEDLAVHILLDSSASMDWPGEQTEGYSMPEETNKLLFGKKLADSGLIDIVCSGSVRHATQDDGEWPPARRQIDICQQIDAVSHLDLHILGHANAATADGCLQ